MKMRINKSFSKFIVATLAIALVTLLAPPSAFASTPTYTSAKTPKLLELQALTFRSTAVTVNGKRYVLASKDSISLRFEEKTISITAGCNTLGGNFSLSNGIIRAQTLFNTKMMCPEKMMDQDVWLNKLFSSNPKLTVQHVTAKSKVKSPATVLTLTSNHAPSAKPGKTIIKMNVYESYGFADTPLANENSLALVKATCKQLILNKATEVEAQFAAEQNALLFRVLSREDENFAVTYDYRENRINVAIIGGKVTTCTHG